MLSRVCAALASRGNRVRTHIPYLICSIFPPCCLLWPCFLNQLTAAGWAVTSACGIGAPDPGWHWRDSGMSPSNACEPSRAINPLVGDSKRHLRIDPAALDNREVSCPQQGHRAVLVLSCLHPNSDCAALTGAVCGQSWILHRRVGQWCPLCFWGCVPPEAPEPGRAWQQPQSPCVCSAVGWGEDKFPNYTLEQPGLSILGRRE